MHRTLTAVLFGFSLLMTGQAFAAPPGTTIYWIKTDFCRNTCYNTSSSCNNKCTAGECIVPPGQYHESTSLTELSNLVGGWALAEGARVHADMVTWWSNSPSSLPPYNCRYLQTPPLVNPECTAVSGNLSCTVSGSPWIEVCDTWQDGPRSSRRAARMGCYLGQYTTSSPCSIKLTGPGGTNGALADVEPGKVISGLAATVTCNNAPSDKVVILTVAADANTGGHLNHGGTRPPGVVLPDSGNGVVPFSFTASPVSGDHTVTAKCADGTCGEDVGKVWVGIKDLVSMAPSIDYAFVGGVGTTHPDNHYLTPTADGKAKWLALLYRLYFPANPILHLNDASLIRGGLFDITAVPWVIDHLTHRLGKEIDVRANPLVNPATSIPEANFEEFELMVLGAKATFCGKGKDNVAYRGSVKQHYHVCLNGGHCCSGGN